MAIVTDNPLRDAVTDVLVDVAREIVLPHFRTLTEAQIVEKAADDVVTVADTLAEEETTARLTALLPGVPVVGEEAAHGNPAVLDALGGQCWIVDPIDGTNNYAHGEGPFGIMVALAEGGLAQAGWLYDPLRERLCFAQRGSGAFINGERLSARPTQAEPPIAAISTLFMDDAERAFVERQIAPHYTLVDIPRCAAEQYPRLALGENDVSIFNRTHAWDHAAGTLWLNEAGGKVARPDGSAYRVDEPDRTGLIGAASPALWGQLAAMLEKRS